MKRGLIILILLVFLLPVGFAEDTADIAITTKAVKDTIQPGEWAEYIVTVFNNRMQNDQFRIIVEQEGVEWSALTKPQTDMSGFIVRSKRAYTTNLLLKDINLPRAENKPHMVKITIQSLETKKSSSVLLPVYTIPLKPPYSTFTPNVDIETHFPEFIDPRKSYSFRVDLINNNLREYDSLDLSIIGKTIDLKTTVELESNTTKTIDFTVSFSPDQEPIKDNLRVVARSGNNFLDEKSVPIEIVSYKIPFDKEIKEDMEFLLKTQKITFVNNQNIEEEQKIMIESNFLDFFITSTEPGMDREKIDGKTYYTTKLSLRSGDIYEVDVYTNYRLVLYAVLLLAFAIFLYYMFKSPLTVTKQAESIHTKEGAITGFKVRLTLKNKDKKDYDNIQIIERVPGVLRFDKNPEHSTLKTTKVVTTKKGDVVYWDLDLSDREERILTFRLVSKLAVLGDLRLPPTVVKFKIGKHEVSTKSNELDVSGERMHH